jgi:hypothetical protein
MSLCPLGTSVTIWSVLSALDDECDCGAFGGVIGKGAEVLGEKSQIAHVLTGA